MGENKPKSAATPQAEDGISEKMIGGSAKHRARSGSLWRKCIGLVGVVVLLVGGAIAGYLVYRAHRPAPVTVVCSDSVTKQGNEQNKSSNLTTFGELVDQIKGNQDYIHDPNCLYIVAQYQIISSDLTTAKTTIATLRSKYPKFVFSKSLDDGKASISNLQKQFDFMQGVENNAHGSIDPTI
ncbi:MAG TPA: hypothetical protein VLF60_03745 [Candidatus Saccharimonadales bacterium]|nr:hypothetical protein [Candidatus Saccharimonadales bacterium]